LSQNNHFVENTNILQNITHLQRDVNTEHVNIKQQHNILQH